MMMLCMVVIECICSTFIHSHFPAKFALVTKSCNNTSALSPSLSFYFTLSLFILTRTQTYLGREETRGLVNKEGDSRPRCRGFESPLCRLFFCAPSFGIKARIKICWKLYADVFECAVILPIGGWILRNDLFIKPRFTS